MSVPSVPSGVPPLTATLGVHVCGMCDSVHLDLFDAQGRLAAAAVMPIEVVDGLIEGLQRAKRALAMRPKTSGAVQ